ncbi:uncharacterized protein cspp1a [Xenentodon cancila]
MSYHYQPEQNQTSADANSTPQGPPFSVNTNTNTNIPPPHKELPTSRRDAATLTEDIENGRPTGGRTPGGRDPGPRMRRRRNVCRSKEPPSSTEELNTDEEEMLDFRTRRRRGRHIQNHEYRDKRKAPECHVDRAFEDIIDVEASAVHYQNNNEKFWKSSRQMQDSMRTAVRSTSDTNKNNAEFATGLMIGATEEQSVTQMRKEQYRQELLRQIAEQQRNKIKEKKLDLRVAATGATDPEKETDRIKQFGAAYKLCGSFSLDDPRRPRRSLDPNPRPKNDKPFKNIEQRAPLGKFQADLSTALSQLPMNTAVPGMGLVHHDAPLLDYFSEDHYRNFTSMQGEAAIPRASPYGFERLHVDTSNQRRESVISYQEALRQQMKEREERKRREKEERKLSDAKLEAEMMAYNPWGRGGAGAPIKDQNGNLVSDLNQMRRINNCNMSSPGAETKKAFSYQLSASRHQSPLQQHQTQNRYKEDLRQQVEEKKRKEAEERERLKIAEKEEERRIAKERTRIWQEFEEERRKQSSQLPGISHLCSSIRPTTDTQQGVIKELSALRRYLKKEQRQLERQMSQSSPQETHHSLPYRRRPRVDAFESTTKQAVQPPGKFPFHVPASVNKENVKEFKPLKNRDACSGDAGEGPVCQQGSRQPSAERTASQRRLHCENTRGSVGQTEVESHSDNQSLCSFKVGSLNHQRIMRRQPHHGDNSSKSGLAVDEVDASSLRSALGRSVSVETVATEPWLRPGTSDAAKQCREKPNSSMGAI